MEKALLDYIRRLSEEDKKTLSQKALKAAEEVGELAKATLPFDNAYATNHRFVEKEKILEEAVDTILTALSVAYDLKFSDEQVLQMMWQKSQYWDSLQQRERNLKYPIPFEIHVTVEPTNEATRVVDRFRAICAAMIGEIKPVMLDLHMASGRITQDIMTSSKILGTNSQAYNEMQYVSGELRRGGYKVIREKIETVPWHPAAPQVHGQMMPPNCYFETHIEITLPENLDPEPLRSLCKKEDMHLSQNVFKKNPDGTTVIMATYRDYSSCYGNFQYKTNHAAESLRLAGYQIGRPIIEFSIYDTKLSHDFSWLGKSDEIG